MIANAACAPSAISPKRRSAAGMGTPRCAWRLTTITSRAPCVASSARPAIRATATQARSCPAHRGNCLPSPHAAN